MEQVNVHIRPSGDKTAQLTCNWCGEPHQVEPSYREEILKRGAEKLAEMRENHLTPEQTWTCGRCMLWLTGLPAEPSVMSIRCQKRGKYD